MKNKYLVCVPLCIIAIFARSMLTADVDIVMALINVAAFLFVVYFAYNDMIIKANGKINKLVEKKDLIQNTYHEKKFWSGLRLLAICVAISSIYIFNFTCPLGNDAISITALGLSVISDEISEKWSDIICERVQKKIEKQSNKQDTTS